MARQEKRRRMEEKKRKYWWTIRRHLQIPPQLSRLTLNINKCQSDDGSDGSHDGISHLCCPGMGFQVQCLQGTKEAASKWSGPGVKQQGAMEPWKHYDKSLRGPHTQIQTPEVRQRKTNIIWYLLCMQSLKKILQMNLCTKQKQIHRHRRQTWDYWRGRIN